MKRFLSSLGLTFVVAIALTLSDQSVPSFASTLTIEETVSIQVFEQLTCPHCKAEKEFLKELQTTRGDLSVVFYDVANDEASRDLFKKLTNLEKLPKVTPLTLIGSTLTQGFDSAETTGKRFVEIIEREKGKEQPTIEAFIEAGGSGAVEQLGNDACGIDGSGDCAVQDSLWVTVPFVGPVDVIKYSLPILATVLGFVDGFNPCAMWVLVMLLTLLVQAGSKRRMWEMAGLFILAEAIMYYLILTVWMTTWDFVGLDNIVTPIVGLVSLGAGLFFLKEYFWGDSTCKVGDLESKRKTVEKIKHYATSPMTIMTAFGIIALALSVNIIEFACSIGIPQAFTKILDLNPLSFVEKQGLMGIYIFMYMFDDLIVFGVALWSFEKIGLTAQKYTRASHLIGGVIMLILGLLFLFKPELLVL